jgi:hypothetical protein
MLMSQALIDELRRENLCTHFVLPLLKLNKFSFIASNFVNCYLTPAGDLIVVQVMDTSLLSRKVFLHPEYRGQRVRPKGDDHSIYLLFQVPVKWKEDVAAFIRGKFSQMSKAAKDTIRRHSGLPYHERTGEGLKTVTDGRLLALEQHKLLKNMWESMVQPREEIQGELLSIPGEDSYIDPLDLMQK